MFNSLNPVITREQFVDRPELHRLLRHLKDKNPSCVALVGLSGAGKSSLMHLICDILKDKWSVGIASLSRLGEISDSNFEAEIALATGSDTPSLDGIEETILAREKITLLCIDDFDKVSDSISGALLSRFRALLTTSLLGRLVVVTASKRPLYELCEAVRGSAFYNIFFQEFIRGIEESLVTALSIKQEVISDSGVWWRVSAGFPSIIVRLVASEWDGSETAEALISTVDSVASLLNGLNPLERILVREIALSDDVEKTVATAPPDRVAFLRSAGLVNSGGLTCVVLQVFAGSIVSLSEVSDIPEGGNLVLLRRLELAMRDLVREAIKSRRIPPTCYADALETKQYAYLQERRQKQRFVKNPDDCDSSYLFETKLVIAKNFGSFSDKILLSKKEFDRLFEVLLPSRNEEFHHHFIPEIEQQRTMVCVHDLLKAISR